MTVPTGPRFRSLGQWLDWQAQLHPRAIDLGLERVRAVHARMACARPGRVVITVGGTNGKGSCVAHLEAILEAAGYRTGAYSSPHLYRYNERIRLAGQPVEDERICQAFDRVDRAREGSTLTYFEFGTLAALDILGEAQCDVALLEVGLGGRLDAVNIEDADLALITNVALEHTAWLGRDRESIGSEKAGILRAGAAAVVGEPEPPRSLLGRAAELGCDLALAGRDFHYAVQGEGWTWQGRSRRLSGLPVPALPGRHQLDNAAAAIMALELLERRLDVSARALAAGLMRARAPGRFEVRPGSVPVILDVAHNPAAAAALAQALAERPCGGRTLAVLGVLADKDLPGMARALAGQVGAWYVSAPAVERALPGDQAAAEVRRLAIGPVQGFERLEGALAAARMQARAGDRILVLGSFMTVAQLGGLV